MSASLETLFTNKYRISKPMRNQIYSLCPNLRYNHTVQNIQIIEDFIGEPNVKPYICRYPRILEKDLDSWRVFLVEYGVCPKNISKIFQDSPCLFMKTDIYHFGKTIMLLKSQGICDNEIKNLYIPYKTEIFCE